MTAPTQTATSSAITARTIQAAIAARAMHDAVTLWPMLDAKRLDATFPGWLQAMMLLIRNYHGQSSAAAGIFYRQIRSAALDAPTPSRLVRFAPDPAEEWLRKALGFAGPGMLQRDTAKPGTALSTTLGTTARIVQDGGRTTILNTTSADKVAVGWYRVTDGDPCAFCALMAARPVIGKRGLLYESEQTAGRSANVRFDGAGQFKFHDNCGCTIAPMFRRDQELPDVNQQAADLYVNRGDGDALNAFRRAWEARNTR